MAIHDWKHGAEKYGFWLLSVMFWDGFFFRSVFSARVNTFDCTHRSRWELAHDDFVRGVVWGSATEVFSVGWDGAVCNVLCFFSVMSHRLFF